MRGQPRPLTSRIRFRILWSIVGTGTVLEALAWFWNSSDWTLQVILSWVSVNKSPSLARGVS
jgi:hypothetical protein